MQRLELVLQLEGSRGRRVDKQTNALRYRGLSGSTKILALIRWGQFGALVCICEDSYGGILFLDDFLVTFQNFKLAPGSFVQANVQGIGGIYQVTSGK